LKKFKAVFFAPLALSLLLWGCLEELGDLNKIEDYVWNPNVAIPIANSTFGLVEFLEDPEVEDYIGTDENGLIIFSYEDQFESQDAASYVEIPDETFDASIQFPSPILIQLPIDITVSTTESFDITLDNPEGDEIDSALLSGGNIALDIQANFPASGEVTFIFHSALENGVPLQRTYTWGFTGQQPVLDISDIIDLSGFKFDLTEGGTTTNSFQFDAMVTINYEGQPVLASNSLDLNVQILSAGFDSVYGLFATRDIESDPETIQLDFFESLLEGSFYLDEPSISLEFGNSFGLPIGVDLGNLTFSNATETQNLTGSVTMSQQIIGAPDFSQIGETVISSIIIDNTTSNLPDLVSMLPTEITYQLSGTINPAGLNQHTFVLGTSKVDIGLKLELPLIGRISDLKIDQEFELDGSTTFDDINYALFKITIANGFPLGAVMQVSFLDQAGQVLDVLIDGDQNLINAAPVDDQGIVTESEIKVTEIEFDKAKIDAVLDTKTLLLEVFFTTTDDGTVSVRMLDSYEMNVKMGVQTEFNVVLDL
jgi:hypothetical protein